MKKNGMPKKSLLMASALVALAATTGYGVQVIVANIVGVSTDQVVGLNDIDAGGTVGGGTQAAQFRSVSVNMIARQYVVTGSGRSLHNGNTNQLVIARNNANVNGTCNTAANAIENLVTNNGALVAAATFNQLIVFPDATPGPDAVVDSFASLVGIGRFQ